MPRAKKEWTKAKEVKPAKKRTVKPKNEISLVVRATGEPDEVINADGFVVLSRMAKNYQVRTINVNVFDAITMTAIANFSALKRAERSAQEMEPGIDLKKFIEGIQAASKRKK